MEIDVDKAWWKEIFDDLYLQTDARSVCDEDLTRREVDYIVKRLNIEGDDRILDLCGGQGRHTFELYMRGFSGVTLFDYAPRLVAIGRNRALKKGWDIPIIRGDARQTGLTSRYFNVVVLLGSSFGYFVEEYENSRILKEAFRLLLPGGRLLLDLPLRKYVERNFQPVLRHCVDDDIDVTRTRVMQDGVIYACEKIASKSRGTIRENHYCTRLYRPAAITQLLQEAGFISVEIDDNYMDRSRSGDFGAMTNRMVVTAQKR